MFIKLIGLFIVLLAGAILGWVLRDKKLEKYSAHMRKYGTLTTDSRRLVDGYTDARMVRDEQTTYKQR